MGEKEDMEYAKNIGCAGVMIGRASMGNPDIFSDLEKSEHWKQTLHIEKHKD